MRHCVEFVTMTVSAYYVAFRAGTYQILDLAEELHSSSRSARKEHALGIDGGAIRDKTRAKRPTIGEIKESITTKKGTKLKWVGGKKKVGPLFFCGLAAVGCPNVLRPPIQAQLSFNSGTIQVAILQCIPLISLSINIWRYNTDEWR